MYSLSKTHLFSNRIPIEAAFSEEGFNDSDKGWHTPGETKLVSWVELKELEKKFYERHPEFYKVVRKEAERLNAPFEKMWLEQMYEDEEYLGVTYYPHNKDWNFEVHWDIKKNCLEESFYRDNGNGDM